MTGPDPDAPGAPPPPAHEPDDATRLVHAGSHPEDHHGFVNPPPYRGSTVLFPSVAALHAGTDIARGGQRYVYGFPENPSSDALAEALTALEGPGAVGTLLCPTGLSACTTAILSVVNAGEHLLVPDNVYGPVRRFCDSTAPRFGISASYYPPTIGAGIAAYLRPETRAVFTESPGSHTLEIQDLPAIVRAARAHGDAAGRDVLVLTDNTWATPLYLKALSPAVGVDVSILAATKYVVGHADALLGSLACGPRAWERVKAFHGETGLHAGADDVTLALRGLRTMGVRLARHQASALAIARWLETRPEVERVLHPGLPSHPQHALFARDFRGSSGLFSFIPRTRNPAAIDAFLGNLEFFGLGYSWGGHESLALPVNLENLRGLRPWNPITDGRLIRLHIGLEAVADLQNDLACGFERLRAMDEV